MKTLLMNDYVMNLLPSEKKTYLSYDTPNSANQDDDAVYDVHTKNILTQLLLWNFQITN
jgi:hypothetical protein